MSTSETSQLAKSLCYSTPDKNTVFPPPKKFTNALLRSQDITALIRDTEAHERALFKYAPPDPTFAPAVSSISRRSTAFGSRSEGEPFSKSTKYHKPYRQNSAVATLLGRELGAQLRSEGGQTVREPGEVDVDLLLNGAEKLCSIYPIPGAKERISALRSRFDQLTSSITRYEARTSNQTSQLARMNRRGPPNEDDFLSSGRTGDEAGEDKSNETPITAEDLEREEQEIRELERKKGTLEDRVSGMERDLGGLLR
ncbi:MAG: hypothetical protein Q9181_000944 [Wetmoreana brouardii]